ncbi:Hpt domain-containing protein [Salidesulfovibrio onnuriiensis]|uniref:Hpt domain-containing protein n=1 Tax=Salidesulfovibrio onnuriiensis TaxID=2583823 RepID=UPI0011CB64BF|nr:Hpt domain-containing protein [Salidesulfovibrio onnuriiensis]
MGVIFNSSAFMDSLGGDAELAAELLVAYIEDSLLRSEKLGEALQTNDSGVAAKAAHSLKGMSGVVRAQALVEMALDMEATAKDGDLVRVRAVYEKFTGTLDAALEEMRLFLNEL